MVELLTADEAARALRLKKPTLYRWSWSRRVDTVNVGGRLYFERATIEALIRQGRRPARDMGGSSR